jgi:hypothetical protein
MPLHLAPPLVDLQSRITAPLPPNFGRYPLRGRAHTA